MLADPSTGALVNPASGGAGGVWLPSLQQPGLGSVLLTTADGGRASFGWQSVGMVSQTAHPASQVLGFLVAGPQAGSPAQPGRLTPAQVAAVFEPATPPAGIPLQVSAVMVTGGGLRVRFNQPIDLARLRAEAGGAVPPGLLVLMRGGERVPGRLVADPDGRGLAFMPASGVLADGDYTLRVLSGNDGVRSAAGQALDGDGDGQPGGDHLARFTLRGGQLTALADGAAAGGQTLAAASADAAFTTGPSAAGTSANGISATGSYAAEDWIGQRWLAGGVLDPTLWAALTGGVGGMISLAFAPLTRPRPARRAGARPAAADDIRLNLGALARPATLPVAAHSNAANASNASNALNALNASSAATVAPMTRHTPDASPAPAAPAAGWMSRWLGGGGPAKTWRIRL